MKKAYWFFGLLVVQALFFTQTSIAQTTVEQINEKCESLQRFLDNGDWSSSRPFDAGYCMGYMQALYDQRMSNCLEFLASEEHANEPVEPYLKEKLANSFVNFNSRALTQSFLNFADENPDHWNDWPPNVLEEAFAGFPCIKNF